MDVKNICLRCMREKEEPEGACPYCGRSADENAAPPYALAAGTVLKRKYLAGDVLEDEEFHISYAGFDMQSGKRVSIREFFFRGGMQREAAKSPGISIPGNDFELGHTIEVCEEKFETEARQIRSAGDLPGIARIYDVFYENGTVYAVQEYPEAQTLADAVRADGPMRAEDAVKKMLPVMHSLALLHDRQVLHCDITPENILVTESGAFRLFDFGGAKMLGRYDGLSGGPDTQENAYTPVEQLFHEELQPSADEYALAAVLYFAVTGTEPVPSRTRSVKDTLYPPSALGAEIPPKVETVLLKGMAVRRSGRFASVGAFERALRDALAGRVQTKDPEDRKQNRRAWILAIAVILTAVLILIASVLFLKFMKDAVPPSPLRAPQTSFSAVTPLDYTVTEV